MKRLTHLLGLCVLLAACGGGGGGNGGGDDNGGDGGGGGGGAACTPESGKLQITNDNADTVSAEAYDATTIIPAAAASDYLVFGFFATGTSAQSTNSLLDDLPKIGKNGLLRKHFRSNAMLHSLNSNSSVLPYSITGGTFNCPAGGSYNLEINDSDNNNLASEGDVITMTFSNCQVVNFLDIPQSTFNGQLITRLELVTNNSLYQFPFKATFTNNGFTVQTTDQEGTVTDRLDGDVTATFSCTTSNCPDF